MIAVVDFANIAIRQYIASGKSFYQTAKLTYKKMHPDIMIIAQLTKAVSGQNSSLT